MLTLFTSPTQLEWKGSMCTNHLCLFVSVYVSGGIFMLQLVQKSVAAVMISNMGVRERILWNDPI